MLLTGVVQKKSYRSSNRSTNTRMFDMAGNEANGKWVEEATSTRTSI
jgi:hypothetical protein